MRLDARARQDMAILGSEFLKLNGNYLKPQFNVLRCSNIAFLMYLSATMIIWIQELNFAMKAWGMSSIFAISSKSIFMHAKIHFEFSRSTLVISTVAMAFFQFSVFICSFAERVGYWPKCDGKSKGIIILHFFFLIKESLASIFFLLTVGGIML